MTKNIVCRCNGYSMYPTISSGSIISYDNCNETHITPGDIIVMRKFSRRICHRYLFKIKFRKSWYFVEKGDNPFAVPAVVTPKAIIGKTHNSLKYPLWLGLLSVPGIIMGSSILCIKIIIGKLFKRHSREKRR